MKTIKLPNGVSVSIASYVAVWKAIKLAPSDLSVNGFEFFPLPAEQVLREFGKGVSDRINRHIPAYGKGRKWSWIWQTETRRAADQLNHPRLIIHWLPSHLKPRFAHRLWQPD